VEANLLLGSFGSPQGYNDRLFSLEIKPDPNSPLPATHQPLRYGKLPEIHHIFKPDPQSPNILFSLLFTSAVLATLPVILGFVSPNVSLELSDLTSL
jgi:oligosaccharyltransferase complex subunit delta (ribophorin II)